MSDQKECSSRYSDYLSTYCDAAQNKPVVVLGSATERSTLARAFGAFDWRNNLQAMGRKEFLDKLEELCPASLAIAAPAAIDQK